MTLWKKRFSSTGVSACLDLIIIHVLPMSSKIEYCLLYCYSARNYFQRMNVRSDTETESIFVFVPQQATRKEKEGKAHLPLSAI
jgi:hypothetical protein